MQHKVYKVVKPNYVPDAPVKRQLISSSTRHPDFSITYQPNRWITMREGLSFVFLDEVEARRFQLDSGPTHQLWMCESEDAPQQLYGMATRWSWIPLFWQFHREADIAALARVCIACPETYYGVKTLRLFSRLN